MDRAEVKLISLKVSEMGYSVYIELINRPIQGKAQNYILVSKSPSISSCVHAIKKDNSLCDKKESRQWEKPMSTELVGEIFDKLEHTSIPPHRTTGLFGLDGISYTISFGDIGCSSTYFWWLRAPVGWEPLEEIAETLYFHSGKAGYGTY